MFAALLLAVAPPAAPAPPAGDWCRFPPVEVCRRARDANRSLAGRLAQEREVWGAQWQGVFAATIAEADALAEAWAALANAQDDWLSVEYRRQALARYRDRVGRAAYDRGEPPPACPYWRFRELK